MLATYEIFKSDVLKIQEYIKIVNKKAVKLHQEGFTIEISKPYLKEVDVLVGHGQSEKRNCLMVTVTLNGSAPVIEGYTFVGSVKKVDTSDGDVFIASVSPYGRELGIDSIALKERKMECEHCKKIRNRNASYLLVNESEREVKIVGSSCLKLYTGGLNAHSVASYFELLMDIDKELNGWKESVKTAYNIVRYLSWVAKSIRENGWLSKGKAYEDGGLSTYAHVNIIMDKFTSESSDRVKTVVIPTQDDINLAKSTVAWSRSEDGLSTKESETEDYLYALKTVLSSDYLETSHCGIAASSIQAYKRWKLQQAQKVANEVLKKSSQYVGSIKERLSFNATVQYIRTINSDDYGCSLLVVMIDDKGNQIKTFTKSNGAFELKDGQKVQFKGTVTKHDEYNGVKSTMLNRCTF